MSRFYSYLNSATAILNEYEGKEPFSIFLKSFFRKHKKYGSRDRRLISGYCYQYFRLGKAYLNLSVEERILIGVFFCTYSPNKMLETHKPEWNEASGIDLREKCLMAGINPETLFLELFPWNDELSRDIEFLPFVQSFFAQPDVFLRIRPGKKEALKYKFKSKHVPYKELSPHTLSVAPTAKVSDFLSIDSEVVIQDLSSQRVGELLAEVLASDHHKVWDCCAASGGKSILAYDLNPSIKLTVSDIRESILYNLRSRFESAGILNYDTVQVDLTQSSTILNSPFDVIIADVPCSGSGTWGRTPEQISYFEESKIKEYAQLQQTIVSNVIPHLKPGGVLVYITCSVFKKENEENAEFFKQEYRLEELKREVLKGYNEKADSMFVSVLKKSL